MKTKSVRAEAGYNEHGLQGQWHQAAIEAIMQGEHGSTTKALRCLSLIKAKRDVRPKWLGRQIGAQSSPAESEATPRCNRRNAARPNEARPCPPRLGAVAPRRIDSIAPNIEGERKHPQW